MKKFKEFLESYDSYSKTHRFTRFRVSGPKTFDEVKKHPEVLKRAGPHTYMFDASDVERVRLAPGDNKFNAIQALYSNDEDEIVCAKTMDGHWVCAAINVMV